PRKPRLEIGEPLDDDGMRGTVGFGERRAVILVRYLALRTIDLEDRFAREARDLANGLKQCSTRGHLHLHARGSCIIELDDACKDPHPVDKDRYGPRRYGRHFARSVLRKLLL